MSYLVKLFKPKANNINCFWQGLNIQRRAESSKPAKIEEQVLITQLSEEIEETDEDREARIEKLRNKSRLAPQHQNMVKGNLPYPESKVFYHDSVQYKRRAWARYGGEQSKVYPGIAWPDKEDLEAMKEYEQVLSPLSIQEMVAIEKSKIEEKEKSISKRYRDVVEKLKNNDKLISDFYQKQSKKTEEAEKSKKQKDKLFSEIRQHFGFNIDPRDEKFQEMLEIKQKEEAKKKRLERKKQREEKLITMAMEIEKQSSEKSGENSTDSGNKEVKEKSKDVDKK